MGSELPVPGRHAAVGPALACGLVLPAARLSAACAAEGLRRSKRVAAADGIVQVHVGALRARGGTTWGEVHFKVLAGGAPALAAEVGRWLVRHGGWLRAELLVGHLADVSPSPPPSRSAWGRAVVGRCCAPIAAPAAAVAASCLAADDVHQLRVGLRRLRCALRDLHPVCPDLPKALEPALARAFRALGAQRDQEIVMARLHPTPSAGGSGRAQSMPGADDAVALVAGPEFQLAFLQALAYALTPADEPPCRPAVLRRAVRARLDRLHRRVAGPGRRFDRLAEVAQHRVRKRLKRLRYVLEFAGPLFDAARTRRYLAALVPAQDALGAHHDDVLARDAAAGAAWRDGRARLAHEGLAVEIEDRACEARRALRRVAALAPCWRRP